MSHQLPKLSPEWIRQPNLSYTNPQRNFHQGQSSNLDLSCASVNLIPTSVNNTSNPLTNTKSIIQIPINLKQESNPLLLELQQYRQIESDENFFNQNVPNGPLYISKSLRTLATVRLENSPSVRRRNTSDRDHVNNVAELLDKVQPSQVSTTRDIKRREPNLNLKPRKSSLVAQVSLYKGIVKKPRVSFREESEVIEVESWKLFNVDMAKKLKIEALKNRKDLCLIF
jgi:hypothetical protein